MPCRRVGRLGNVKSWAKILMNAVQFAKLAKFCSMYSSTPVDQKELHAQIHLNSVD